MTVAIPKKTRLRDRTGNRIGPLLVSRRGEDQNGKVTWICSCVCGREVVVMRQVIVRMEDKDPTICGCARLRPFTKIASHKKPSPIRELKFSEKGKDEWQVGVLREKRLWEIARGRC